MTNYRGALPQNSFDLKADYGNGDFDTRHNFTALLSYNLPGRSRVPQWRQGWQFSSLLSFHTGQPFPVLTETDNSGTNELVQRVNQVGDPFAGVSHKMVTANGMKFVQWVSPPAFALPALGTLGTMGRNQ